MKLYYLNDSTAFYGKTGGSGLKGLKSQSFTTQLKPRADVELNAGAQVKRSI